MTMLNPKAWWYPGTLHYATYHKGFPFFIRATQHKGFKNLSIITGIKDANSLKETAHKGYDRLKMEQWYNFHFSNFLNAMNMDKLDSIK